MRSLPNLLLLASLPAGMVGYAVGVQLVTLLLPGMADSVLMLFVPLLVAGLCMMPFVIPFIDRKAKADLAAHRARQGAPPPAGSASGDAAPGPSHDEG